MKRYVIYICLYISFSYILSQQPLWFQKPLSVYSTSQFIIGVGEGNSNDEAIELAKADLAQQITMVAQADSTNDADIDPSTYYAEFINANLYKTVNQQMTKAEIKNQDQKNDKYYALVSLNRQQILQSTRSSIDNLWIRILADLKKADEYMVDNHYVSALDTYARAQIQLSDLMLKKFFYDNLSNTPYPLDETFSDTMIENYVKNLISTINFEVKSGNQQTTRKGTILPKPIIFYASAKKNGKNIVLNNLPVGLFYGNGDLIETGNTASDGRYTLYALAVPHTTDTGRIHIQIDPSKFPHFYNRNLRNKVAVAHFQTTMAAPLFVSLSVNCADIRQTNAAQNQIVKILTSQNIRESDRAACYVKATVIFKHRKQLTENLVVINHTTANISLEFGVINTKQIIGFIDITGEGTSDRNEQEAVNLALINSVVNPKELTDMIERASRAVASISETASIENLQRGKRMYVEGKYREAQELLLSVNVGDENIVEAVNLLNIIKRQIR